MLKGVLSCDRGAEPRIGPASDVAPVGEKTIDRTANKIMVVRRKAHIARYDITEHLARVFHILWNKMSRPQSAPGLLFGRIGPGDVDGIGER